MNNLDKFGVRSLWACVIAAALGVSPLAYGAPGGGVEVYRQPSDGGSVELFGCDSGNNCLQFWADHVVDNDGVRWGQVSAARYDPYYYNYLGIYCFGPEYAYIASSVNQGNGDTNINVTVDASDPSCFSNIEGAAIAVNVTGRYNGEGHTSKNGISISRSDFGSSEAMFKEDCFSETFTGTTSAIPITTFQGRACANNVIQITQFK